ncbi:selenocysteine synthase [Photobacterium profundum 3TCK]|uniref:Selenocysteine synthase n=1 Tax=Photobacterium profundum 3TCK TaxID=314280 RepID=Q1Z9N5_9GAMM|nr:selenocysteine synthase [Photobacterium profundum 3TCK]
MHIFHSMRILIIDWFFILIVNFNTIKIWRKEQESNLPKPIQLTSVLKTGRATRPHPLPYFDGLNIHIKMMI